MKSVVFWDVALCRSGVDRHFGGTYRLHLQGSKIRKRSTSVGRWLQTESPVGITSIVRTEQSERGNVGHIGNQQKG
jgi:hypothetical protein